MTRIGPRYHTTAVMTEQMPDPSRPRVRIMKPNRRELEVLQCIANGLTIPMAAELMAISPHTANTHTRRCKQKLAAKNLAHAITIAFRCGWLSILTLTVVGRAR